MIFKYISILFYIYMCMYVYFILLQQHQILSQVIAANNVRTFFPDTYSCVLVLY